MLADGTGFYIKNHFRLNLGCPRAYLKELVNRFNILFKNSSKIITLSKLWLIAQEKFKYFNIL